jgi:alkanesulfonate monooxygenase SsuD/methylene tetrahydromethanopterin reductase-like flavin-dependent oxidoreductase (luciferase family)
VAGVTARTRLLASIVLAPTRETTLLARQAATIDRLSGGRLTLGVGVGVRRDDYEATGTPFERRGQRLDEQLPTLRAIWRGEAPPNGSGPIGPATPSGRGPEVLIGGYVDAVARRVASFGDGFMAPGGGEPARMAELWRSIVSAWERAGRAGRPRWVGSSYVALGPSAEDQAAAYIRSAYAFAPALAERRLRGIPTSPGALRDQLARHVAMGVDEYVLRPCSDDPAFPARVAEAVERLPDAKLG